MELANLIPRVAAITTLVGGPKIATLAKIVGRIGLVRRWHPSQNRSPMQRLAPLRLLLSIASAFAGVWRRSARRLIVVLLLSTATYVAGAQGLRWWLVGRLAWQVSRADDAQAPQLVRELARYEAPAYRLLVEAANSPRAAVALSARREIDFRVELWQRKVFLEPASFNLGAMAIPLAEAFARTAPEFAPSARPWAREKVETLAQLAAAQPLRRRLDLLVACDRALMGIPGEDPAAALADAGAAHLGLLLGQAEPTGEPRFPPYPTPLDSQPVATLAALPHAVGSAVDPKVGRAKAAAESEWQRALPLGTLPPNVSMVDSATAEPKRNASPSIPAMEVSRSSPPAMRAELTEIAQPIPEREGPDWFDRLAHGNSAEQQQAAKQLADQGFGQVRREEALLLLSASIEDRKGLVDRVMISPRLEAPMWLKLLLRDRAPEVRASATAAIATSGDKELMSLALQIALRDAAPSVADQVPLLRQRLR
jgi:hypothetical protein